MRFPVALVLLLHLQAPLNAPLGSKTSKAQTHSQKWLHWGQVLTVDAKLAHLRERAVTP
jgi:hypothetical protein